MIASQTLAALGSLAVLLPVALTELPSVFSPAGDPPRIVDARQSPYSAIGKFRGTMTCTAAIVLNPRIIITAGHCVTERDGTTRRSKLSFQLAYQTGTDLGRFKATLWAVGSTQSFAQESIHDASKDWAILILDRAPVGVRPFALRHDSPKALEFLERQILLPAYSNDVGDAEALSVDPNCTVRDLAWDTLIHTCTVKAGSSGAPLLLPEGSAYAVVGIHTASIFASDADGRVGKFVGNQAIGSGMFSEAALRLSRQLDGGPIQTVNMGDY
ncbi:MULTISPECIES: trypsin-like serine protease [unclassified Bradyrhizobium]|uniref:trypsin-like serine peptidase n=1 Tax=unclassified Bradyrhizobium TaxID=2631580 RepID=UPI0024791AE4|nr:MULTISPECIES: trypsin-like serine protease [unclassified Bradyrhizobium]WGS21079.1 trypsin-like serine protease [Bradyrhizobium sp. ISRA463]WGS27996.1 trypsin-like serine protease [Bradyrhizobium sp. ISRA464]